VPHTFAGARRDTTLSYLAGLLEDEGSFMRPSPSATGTKHGDRPAVAAGESGPVLAVEYEMTHQNVYYIGTLSASGEN
jgi:hypothetical protein